MERDDIPIINRPTLKSVSVAVEIYWQYPEIGNQQIKDLFGLTSTGYASHLKKYIKDEMAKRSMKSHAKNAIDTKFAYSCWGLDIADLEKRKTKLSKFNVGGENYK